MLKRDAPPARGVSDAGFFRLMPDRNGDSIAARPAGALMEWLAKGLGRKAAMQNRDEVS